MVGGGSHLFSKSLLGSTGRSFFGSTPVLATETEAVSVADSSRNPETHSELLSCSVAGSTPHSVWESDSGHMSLFQAATVWCGSVLSVLTPFGRFLGTSTLTACTCLIQFFFVVLVVLEQIALILFFKLFSLLQLDLRSRLHWH